MIKSFSSDRDSVTAYDEYMRIIFKLEYDYTSSYCCEDADISINFEMRSFDYKTLGEWLIDRTILSITHNHNFNNRQDPDDVPGD